MVSFWQRGFEREGPWDVLDMPSGDYRIVIRRNGKVWPESPSFESELWMIYRMGEITSFSLPSAIQSDDPRAVQALLDIHSAAVGTCHPEAEELRRACRGWTPRYQSYLRALAEDLEEAIRFGRIRVERLERPWPFLEIEKEPEARAPEKPVDEREETFLYRLRLHDARYERCGSIPYRLELTSGEIVRKETDSTGLLTQRLPKRHQTIRVAYTPPGSDVEIAREVIVIPETKTDADYMDHLRNMGFGGQDEQSIIIAFQAAHRELSFTGTLYDDTKAAIGSMVTGQLKSGIRE